MHSELTDAQGQRLVALARGALAERFGEPALAAPDEPWLRAPGATFVTLSQHGDLRGCIGSIEARRPLGDDVRSNAIAAATRDPRFAPITAGELPTVCIAVSALTPLERVLATTEGEALAALRPGVDGVLLVFRGQKGTLLPKLWDRIPDAAQFVRAVKQKAGLPPLFWHPEIEVWRYTAHEWHEPGYRLGDA